MKKNRDGECRPPIVVEPYDPEWARSFVAFRESIWPHVESHAIAFEHVGSTSVPGLAAKPIIDMDIVVPDMEAAKQVFKSLEPLGYTHRGELGVQGRHAFFHPPNQTQHHLYVCLLGSTGLQNHLALRDYLRSHPEAVVEYGRLKMRLAKQHTFDIDAYIEGKTDFIVNILQQTLDSDAIREVVQANTA